MVLFDSMIRLKTVIKEITKIVTQGEEVSHII